MVNPLVCAFFVVDVLTTLGRLCHGQMLLPLVADVIATGQL